MGRLTAVLMSTWLLVLLCGGASAAEPEAEAESTAEQTAESATPAPAQRSATARKSTASPDSARDARAAVEAAHVEIGANGLEVSSGSGQYSFKIGGRVQVDGTGNLGTVDLTTDNTSEFFYGGGNAPIDGAELRRARIETRARAAGHFIFVGEADFADNEVGVKDFWVGYDGLEFLTIMVGNQKQPYSLAIEESSNDISFMERGIDSFLITPFVDRAVGVRGDNSGSHHYIAVGFYGDGVSPDNDTDDGWGFAGRGIYSPILTDDSVLHLGFRVAYRAPGDDDHEVRLRDETTHMSSLSVVDTGGNLLVDDVTLFGPEMSYAYRFVQLKGEYNYAHFRRTAGASDVDFQSAHVSLSLALNGQNWAHAYRMSAGEFKRLKNVHDFDPGQGHWGEFELAGRWAFIDLDSKDVIGGREQAFTTALNWQLNHNVRMLFDWTYILKTEGPAFNDPANASAEGLHVIGARAQLAF